MSTTGSALERPSRESDVLRAGLRVLRERLPDEWSLRGLSDGVSSATSDDAVLVIEAPDGSQVHYRVEVRSVVEGRHVASLRDRMVEPLSTSGCIVFARYLASNVRRKLADVGLSYVDATGNVLVRASRPGLYIADRGADRDPWRGPGRPRQTLGGAPAANVVRALVDEPGPWRITDLVEFSRTPTGSVYRVVDFLQSEGLVTRDDRGQVDARDWMAILRRWSQDYEFLRTNRVSRWIAPRGIPAFLEKVGEADERDYAVTGTVAAAAWAPYAPARSAMVYVADAERAARAWGLREVDAGVNVLLAEPAYGVALTRTVQIDGGLIAAAPSQVVVDLMTGPGRAPAEAEELLEWMRRNEHSWRR